MQIRPLPRRPKRRKGKPKPRSWKVAPLIGDRAPKCELHVWRLGPDFRELERVVDRRGEPVVLDGHVHQPALQAVIRSPGFYRAVLRDRRGLIRGRQDFQADFHFSADWDLKTARKGYRPQTAMERVAEDRDRLKSELREARQRADAMEAERDAARARIAEIESHIEMRVSAVRAAAARKLADARQVQADLEELLARRVEELARVRRLYGRLARGDDREPSDDDVEADGDEVDDTEGQLEPEAAREGLELERLADKLIGYAERLGFIGNGRASEPDEDEPDEDEDDE